MMGYHNVIRLLISPLWINQEGDCLGGVWLKQVTCLQESEESESCASAGLECEADGQGGRRGPCGEDRAQPSGMGSAPWWARSNKMATQSYSLRNLILPTTGEPEKTPDHINPSWLDFSLMILRREPSEPVPRLTQRHCVIINLGNLKLPCLW